MEPAPGVGRVFFPLDEELALLPGNLAPRQQEHLVHLAAWMPFARVAQMLERLLGVQVSEETVRRLSEQAGRHIQAAQTEQAQQPWQQEEACKQESVRLALSADGAQVPLVNGEWAEVRTLAIGTVKEGCGRRRAEGGAPLVFFAVNECGDVYGPGRSRDATPQGGAGASRLRGQ